MQTGLLFRNYPKLKYYYKIVLVSVFSILLSFVAIYFIMREILVQRIIRDSANNLLSVMNTQDSILDQADRTISIIASDPGITNYIDDYAASQQLKIYNTYTNLERICRENEFFDNICVYYLEDERVLATGWGTSRIKDFIYGNSNAYNTIGRATFIHTSASSSGSGNGMLSMARFIPINYVQKPKAVVSIGISSEYFKSLHNTMNSLGGDYFLTDGSKNLIYGSVTHLSEDVHRLLDDMELTGSHISYTVSRIDGEQQLFSIVKSQKYQLFYSYCIPIRIITADVNFLMYAIMVIAILIVALCACGSVVSIRQLYKPLDKICNVITDFSESGSGIQILAPNDIAEKIKYIFEENRNLISLNKDMEEYFDKYKLYQKNHLLWGLLEGSYEVSDIQENLDYYHIEFDTNKLFCVILFSIDNFSEYRKSFTAEQWNLFKLYLAELASQEFSYSFLVQSAEKNEEEICFILNNIPDYTPDSMQAHGLASARLLHERLNKETRVSLTVGVSEAHSELKSLALCYLEAKKAKDNRWISGFNNVFAYQSEIGQKQQMNFPFDIEKKLISAIKSGKYDEVLEHLTYLYQYALAYSGQDIGLFQHYFLQILSTTYRCLYECYDMCLAHLPTEKEVYINFLGEQTAESMYEKLQDFYNLLFIQLENARSERYTVLAEQVKLYIQHNHQRDITVEMIGEAFNLSASHLRKVFKDETGTSIKVYIDTVRIKKAQELLTNSNSPISDIAILVGYVSQQTFIRVFKKEFGVTPGEYRRRPQVYS